MRVNDFISKLQLALNSKTTYKTGGWGSHNEDTWYFDCVCLIKGILWGWNADFNDKHGGAVYKANNVPDIGTETLINRCTNVSSNFSHIEVGELLWMKGHVGIYVGNGEVIEATTAWDSKVQLSHVDSDGTRSKDGKVVYKWEKHGFLPYVVYDFAKDETNVKTYQVQKGDTISKIAKMYYGKSNKTLWDILKNANNLNDKYMIRVGEILVIPNLDEDNNRLKVGDKVIPLKLVNYNNVRLKQYDDYYIIKSIKNDRVVLANSKGIIWATMNINNIELYKK